MSEFVLDASAALVLLKGEPGKERVAEALARGGAIGAFNVAEVVTKLSEIGQSEAEIRHSLDEPGADLLPADPELAIATGLLRPLTRHLGLSLGDRACLALAQRLGVPALTADRAWAALQIGVVIAVVR